MEDVELIPTLANVKAGGQDIFVTNLFAIRLVSMVNVCMENADATWGGKRKLVMLAYLTGNVLTRGKEPVKSLRNVDVLMGPVILMAFAKASSLLPFVLSLEKW